MSQSAVTREASSARDAGPEPARDVRIRIEQIDGYEFRVRFDGDPSPPLHLDEPPPLGRAAGPSAARLLAAAVGNALCASFLFVLQRASIAVGPLDADVAMSLREDAHGRPRIGAIKVTLRPTVIEDGAELARAVDELREACVVSESVRAGIDVEVAIEPNVDGGLDGPTS